MNKFYCSFSLVLIVTMFGGCETDRCFHASGKETEKIMLKGHFNRIHIHGMFDIELVQDSCYYVEGFAGYKILENIDVSVKNDTLLLYDFNGCFWLREYKRPLLRVHFKDIDVVNIYEASYIFSTDSVTDHFMLASQTMLAETNLLLNTEYFYFYVHHTTGGRYVFRGKSQSAYMSGYYSSVIDASELECSSVVVRNNSIADIKVWATEEIKAEIYNSGNIYYKGNPSVITDSLMSTGRLLPMVAANN
ncbi:MAG: DUF2807 domain-containing protein [Bacteroidales bacterium]|nr:DUF2807 domain-containing protein [Bacteroidales bacterium]